MADPPKPSAPPAPPTASGRAAWSRSDTSGAIYGTIAATAVIAATAQHQPLGRVLVLTAATLVVFWLAHVYASVLSHHLRGTPGHTLAVIGAAMAEERPMLEAPAASLLVLLLGVVGLLGDRFAVVLALWMGVAQLVGWGVASARRQGLSWFASLLAGVINGLLGLVIVVLEVLLH